MFVRIASPRAWRMIDFSTLPAVSEHAAVDRACFCGEIQRVAKPVVMRGLVADWPAVGWARASIDTLHAQLMEAATETPVEAFFGTAAMGGRFFYDEACTGFNFERHRLPLRRFLELLRQQSAAAQPAHLYAGAVRIPESLPGLLEAHRPPLLDPAQEQLNAIWIGNRTRIGAHWDWPENFIHVIAGRRRYILFPPEQIGNLYCGPIDFTPAGQPLSLVDFHAPDFERFPRFAEALRRAQIAELGPGDVLYLPSLWWHHAESLDDYGVMINSWWREQPRRCLSPRSTLLHALMSLRELPAPERRAWRAFFDHYVFDEDAPQAAAHIPEAARGVLGAFDDERAARLRAQIMQTLNW